MVTSGRVIGGDLDNGWELVMIKLRRKQGKQVRILKNVKQSEETLGILNIQYASFPGHYLHYL